MSQKQLWSCSCVDLFGLFINGWSKELWGTFTA